ncbi:MAG TPA: deoxynucleoside kinase, partial [Anaerolineae bacterium]|nr:deoxynucleoside kinase [Anaerolineae bacterium]
DVLKLFLPPPHLVVYLEASVPMLLKRIALRGRDYEKNIAPEYLEQLNRLYQEWIGNFKLCPVLTVPSDRLDYVQYDHDLQLLIEKIQQKLRGEQYVLFE